MNGIITATPALTSVLCGFDDLLGQETQNCRQRYNSGND
jgi:hypothetical protein